jgi:hypothetical protein
VEMEFFSSCIAQSPTELITSHNPQTRVALAGKQVRLAALNRRYEDAKRMIGVMPVEEVREIMDDTRKELVAVQSEIDKAINLSFSERVAAGLWKEIAILLTQKYGESTILQANEAALALHEQLADENIRGQLAKLLPSVVGGLVIDLARNRYAVLSVSGVRGEWRDVSAYAIQLRTRKPYTPETRALMSEKCKARYLNGWWTPERRKQWGQKMKGRVFSKEHRKKMSESAKKIWTPERKAAASVAVKARLAEHPRKKLTGEKLEQFRAKCRAHWEALTPAQKKAATSKMRKVWTSQEGKAAMTKKRLATIAAKNPEERKAWQLKTQAALKARTPEQLMVTRLKRQATWAGRTKKQTRAAALKRRTTLALKRAVATTQQLVNGS